ncbi:MAG: Asp-tRNA(Asn)/Glu-tRNA(Gln) amidotransferase subunit GatC [Desulfovibrionaceae bacterium]|nr:Asp-tRNA(Asn)/Glu-tRNA(Gln) amidotransferase subunit GatC [Desulfovibrionaceae bacterium]
MLTTEDLLHLARLARLSPDEAELKRFGAQCGEVLRYMDCLSEVNTDAVDPLYSPVEHSTPYRKDEPRNGCSRDMLLANAPERDGQFFAVPKIVG